MSNLFQKLELAAFRAGITPRSEESRDWFRKKASDLRRINRKELQKEQLTRSTPTPGSMYMFFYDPKTKDKLPYYDTFPLVIMIGPAKKAFYGLNLHYLSPVLRAKFLDALLDTLNNKAYDETTKFRVTYNMLKRLSKFRFFEPCFKHYLFEHVRSKYSKIEAPDWEIATFLPTADFKSGGVGPSLATKNIKNMIYNDSKRAING